MGALAIWCGFLGAWAVAAGAVYQAVIELQAEESASDRIRVLATSLPAPPAVSRWWWLLPPVAFFLNSKRRERHRDLIVHAMTEEELETQLRFMHKATGWAFVGTGALLIGTNETYALVEHEDWSDAAFWALVALMVAGVVANALVRHAKSANELAKHRRSHAT